MKKTSLIPPFGESIPVHYVYREVGLPSNIQNIQALGRNACDGARLVKRNACYGARLVNIDTWDGARVVNVNVCDDSRQVIHI